MNPIAAGCSKKPGVQWSTIVWSGLIHDRNDPGIIENLALGPLHGFCGGFPDGLLKEV